MPKRRPKKKYHLRFVLGRDIKRLLKRAKTELRTYQEYRKSRKAKGK
jgi:hypothetical protein